MGKKFLDEYSLLHFAVGVVAKHWALNFWFFIAIHTAFEYLENTVTGMKIINTYITAWPGGKSFADSFINRFGDTLSAALGWLIADYLLAVKPSL